MESIQITLVPTIETISINDGVSSIQISSSETRCSISIDSGVKTDLIEISGNETIAISVVGTGGGTIPSHTYGATITIPSITVL